MSLQYLRITCVVLVISLFIGFNSICQGISQDRFQTEVSHVLELMKSDSMAKAKMKADSLSHLLLSKPDSTQLKYGFSVAEKYRELHKYKAAASTYEMLVNASRNTLDSINLSRSLYYLGMSYKKMGLLNKASIALYEGMNITQLTGDQKRLCLIQIQIGSVHKALKQYDKALSIYSQAFELSMALKEEELGAAILNNLGSAYKKIGNYIQAREHYLRAIEINKRLNNDRNLSYNYNNLANIYEEMGDLNRALQYQKESIDLKKKINDQPMLAMSLSNLSIIYQKMNQIAVAESLALEALSLASNYSNAASIEAAYKQLISIQMGEKDHEAALKSLRSLCQFQDSLRTAEREELIRESEAQYERQSIISLNEANKRKLQNADKLNFKKGSITALFVSMSALILILLYVCYITISKSSKRGGQVQSLLTEIIAVKRLNKIQTARLDEVNESLKRLDSAFKLLSLGLNADLRKEAEALRTSMVFSGENTEESHLKRLISSKLLRRIDDLQDVIDHSNNTFGLNHQSFLLSDIFLEMESNLKSLLLSNSIKLSVDYPTPSQVFVGDKRRLEQVLTNILEHAISQSNDPFIEIVVQSDAADNGQALVKILFKCQKHSMSLIELQRCLDMSNNMTQATSLAENQQLFTHFNLLSAASILRFMQGELQAAAAPKDGIEYIASIELGLIVSSSE